MLSKIQTFLFTNGDLNQTIAKNTLWLFLGQILGRVFRAAVVIYAARVLGAGSWGAFSYALGIAAFLTIFSDIGINALITKEASRNPELKDQYLSTAFFIKLLLLAVFIIGVIVFFPYLTNIPEAAMIMPVLIFVFAFDTLRDLGSALSRALEKMEIEGGINIMTNLAITVAGFFALYYFGTSYSLSVAYAVGSGAGFFAIFYILRHHFKNIFKNYTPSLIKPILVTAWPFGLLGLMGAIMLNTDIIMLGWMRTPEEVGYYSAAQKLILLAYVIPGLLASSTFPAMARFAKTSPEKARMLLKKSVKLLTLTAIPLIAGGLLLSGFVFNLLYGPEYAPGILTFQILLFTLIIVYPATLLGNALFAYDEQRYFLKFVVIATTCNALFNLALIPPYGIEGAAISTIATQLITNAFIYFKVKKVTGAFTSS